MKLHEIKGTNPVLLRVEQQRCEYFLRFFKDNPQYKYIVISDYHMGIDYNYYEDIEKAKKQHEFRFGQASCLRSKIMKVSEFKEEKRNILEHLWS